MRTLKLGIAVAVMLLAGTALAAPAGPPLTTGAIINGATTEAAPAAFQFDAKSPGLLAVAVRGSGDLMLFVTDEDGQALVREDSDFGGDRGAEQLMVPLPAAARYFVFVASRSEHHTFELGASWLAFPKVAKPADPDGRPGTAGALEIGKKAGDQIHPAAGDEWDWFKITVAEAGSLTVLTKVDGEGDLALEVYEDGKFLAPLDKSDKDLRGNKGNESVTVEAAAGQTFYFRVKKPVSSGDLVEYSISSGFIPQ